MIFFSVILLLFSVFCGICNINVQIILIGVQRAFVFIMSTVLVVRAQKSKEEFEEFDKTLKRVLNYESVTCGDPFVRLSQKYSLAKLADINMRINALLGMAWFVEAMFIAEVGILLLVLIVVLMTACGDFKKNAFSLR